MLKLYNTLTRKVEDFQPIHKNTVNLYTCGPTVYDYAHIGNLRTYIFEDLLRRTLTYLGYTVKHAMNITDVGHLVGDGDEGEDKMDKGAKREGKHPLEIARMYEDQFFKDEAALNILPPHEFLRATDSIPEQIDIIKILEKKGFTYKDEFAIYFDTAKFPDYGKLSGQKMDDKKTGAREEVVIDIKKKNPQDFVLWFFTKGKYEHHILRWDSPWGEGFPGWHIECSAISRKLLGQPFDIHCGGVDHIGTHHPNEIAQSETAFGMPLANFWLHGEHLLINAGRMAKSEGTGYTLQTIFDKGFGPLVYRYFCLQANWRTQLNFTWEALEAAKNALEKLKNKIAVIARSADALAGTTKQSINQNTDTGLPRPSQSLGARNDNTIHANDKFIDAISNDLNLPQALAILWEVVNDNELNNADKYTLIQKFDSVLGLSLDSAQANPIEIPEKIQKLITMRDEARKNRDFAESDSLRKQIEDLGFAVKDTPDGTQITKI